MENLIFPNTDLAILAQLVLALVLGMVIGAERSIAGKTAGMRTYALVSLGSCLFVVISAVMTGAFLGVATLDPLRMASSVIVGVGFIGAGIIIFRGAELRGLTTAAGLWVAAGVGMAVGYKLYLIAVFATALTLFAFTVLWVIEEYVEKKWNFYVGNEKKEDTV
jgi:putative Mg2+ transporter-C (MgtC) family protein